MDRARPPWSYDDADARSPHVRIVRTLLSGGYRHLGNLEEQFELLGDVAWRRIAEARASGSAEAYWRGVAERLAATRGAWGAWAPVLWRAFREVADAGAAFDRTNLSELEGLALGDVDAMRHATDALGGPTR